MTGGENSRGQGKAQDNREKLKIMGRKPRITGGEVRDRPVCMPVPAGMPGSAPLSADVPVSIPLFADMPGFCTVAPKHAGPPPCHPEEAEPTQDLFPVSLTGGGGKKILRCAQDDRGKLRMTWGKLRMTGGENSGGQGKAQDNREKLKIMGGKPRITGGENSGVHGEGSG